MLIGVEAAIIDRVSSLSHAHHLPFILISLNSNPLLLFLILSFFKDFFSDPIHFSLLQWWHTNLFVVPLYSTGLFLMLY